MPEHIDDWFSRIKSIEREYQSVAAALHSFIELSRRDATVLAGYHVQPSDLMLAQDHVEATYIVRLYAQFESGLRSFWASLRSSSPPSRDLIDGVAAIRTVPAHIADNAHAVRRFRNTLVHELDQEIPAVTIQAVRKSLSVFFARLPREW